MADGKQASSLFLDWQSATHPPVLKVQGAWRLSNYAALKSAIARVRKQVGDSDLTACRLDLQGVTELDTAGAMKLIELVGPQAVQHCLQSGDEPDPARRALLQAVLQTAADWQPPAGQSMPRWQVVLAEIGQTTEVVWQQVVSLLGFIGLTLQALLRCVVTPTRWRPTAVVAQIDLAGLRAVPIVMLLTFMVGAVVAFLGATILADFGATLFTVNLVGFSFLREFAVLLTAILIAGRTASAYTAQLGLMKVNEEIDALRMTGMDPVELLVVPRVLALLVALPILTFIGMLSGILGGLVVCVVALDISPSMFFAVFSQSIPVRHFVLGMAKAPIFAFLIAVIGCSEGFKVQGSAQSVGARTTSSVVQSIFVVILLDAVAALFYMEMGW